MAESRRYPLLNVMEKIASIEIIEITKEESGGFILRLFTTPSTYVGEKVPLKTSEPIEFDSIAEIRGFLKGFLVIIGTEFFATEAGSDFLQLTSWMHIERMNLEICHAGEEALIPQNLPDDIFEAKITKKLLRLKHG